MAPKEKKPPKAKKDEKIEKAGDIDAAAGGGATDKVDSIKVDGSLDFEAGVIFNKYDKSKSGVITADDFRQMWRETKENNNNRNDSVRQAAESTGISAPGSNPTGGSTGQIAPEAVQPNISFEAGKMFQNFDKNNDGKLDKLEFESLMNDIPGLIHRAADGLTPKKQATVETPTASPTKIGTLPMEIGHSLSQILMYKYDT